MASPMSLAATLAVAAAVAGLMWFSIKRNGRIILERDFIAPIEPPDDGTRCDVRFPMDEASTDCVLSATAAGLYMATPAEAIAKRSWTSTRCYLRQPVLIPWSRLQYGPAKFPAMGMVRFDVTGTRIVFFVRKSVVEMVLGQKAGR